MNLIINYWATSGYDFPVKICRGEVRYWNQFRRRTFSRIQITDYMPPRILMDFRAIFPVTPLRVPDDQPFQAKLFFIDNLNRRHKAGKFVFETHDPIQPYPPD